MDGWIPSTIGLPPPKKKHALPKPPTEARQHNEEGVSLVPGSIGSVRLDVKGSRNGPKELKLRFLAQQDSDSKLQELRPPVRVFPDTSSPKPDLPDLTPSTLAQQGKLHLDNHPSMMHIPFELVYSTVREAASEARAPQLFFDPFVGNRLVSTWAKLSDAQKRIGVLAFPMGEGGDQLSVSPIRYSGRTRHQNDIFTPCAQPVVDFKRPILQIVASPFDALNPAKQTQHPTLAVRTLSSTNFIRLRVNPSHRAVDRSLPFVAEEINSVSRSLTNGRRHADVAMSPRKAFSAMIVNDEGALFEWGVEMTNRGRTTGRFKERSGSFNAAASSSSPNDRTLRQFHRVDFGSTPTSANLLSSHSLRQVDLRTRDSETLLYSLAGSTSLFTSLEQRLSSLDAFNSPLVCFSSTESVSWVDVRMPGRAVIKWEHGRAFDRSLQVLSGESQGVTTTFLTSRLNNLTTAYTLSTSNPSVPTSLHDPYLIPPPPPTSSRTPFVRAGTTLFRHPAIPSERDEVSLFELSDRGGVVLRKLGRKVEDDEEELERMRSAHRAGREGFDWMLDVKALAEAEQKEGESGEVAEIEKREVKVVDLRKQYEDVFTFPKSIGLATKLEIFSDMESLFQELDAPLEQMVTPHEMALMSASEGPPAFRSDFLAASTIVAPAPGTMATLAGHLSNLEIGKDSTFHHSVSGRIQTLIGHPSPTDPLHPPVTLANAATTADRLRAEFGIPPTFSALSNKSTGPQAFAYNACDVLAFDLALASDVYSSDPMSASSSGPGEPEGIDDVLARATQAMSLVKTAPELSYSYLRPVMKKGREQLGEEGLQGNTTARMLMSKWVIGEDPEEYKHLDLRRSAAVEAEEEGGGGMEEDADAEESGPDHPPSQSQSQRRAPPIIASSQPSAPPTITSSRVRGPPVIATTPAAASSSSNRHLFEIPPHRPQQPPSTPTITIRSPSAPPSSSFPSFPRSQPLPSISGHGRHGESSSQPQGGSRSRVASGASASSQGGGGSGEWDTGGESQSQEMPSTQVVSGAFGGKLGGGKKSGGGKKAPKKRTGGF